MSEETYDVVVLGDSLPAFAAALDFAELGLRVRLLTAAEGRDRADAWGDWPTGPERDADGALAELIARVAAPLTPGGQPNEAVACEQAPASSVLMRNTRAGWSAVPEPSVFGVPAVPVSTDALAFLPFGKAVRAYLDKIKPLLTIGKTRELGVLVRARLGEAVRHTLMEPLVRERYGVPDVEVAIAAPGLNEALTRVGSLSGAVLANSERQATREAGVVPAYGWGALREALVERLKLYGAVFGGEEQPEGVASAPQVRVAQPGAAEAWVVSDGAAEYTARALVVDRELGTASPLPAEVERLMQQPFSLRGYATALVSDELVAAAGVTGLRAAAGAVAGADAVQTVELPSGEAWSLRLSALAGGRVRAELWGPARPLAQGETEAAMLSQVAGAAHEVLAAAGLPLEASDAAGKPTVEAALRAAAYTSVDEREAADVARDAAAEALAVLRTLLATGRALYGDDTAAAVADALERAVLLRRQLAGISD